MLDSTITPTKKKLIWLSRSGPAFEVPGLFRPGGVGALAFVQAVFGAAWTAEFVGHGGSVDLLMAQVRVEARRRGREVDRETGRQVNR